MAIKPSVATAFPGGLDNFDAGQYDPAMALAVNAIESYIESNGVVMPMATASGTGTINTFQPINPNSQLRFIVDGATTINTPTITSAQANFTQADKGKNIGNWAQPGALGGGIPLSTTIKSVTNATTAVMSANATATVVNTTTQIGAPLTWTLPGSVAIGNTMTIKNVSNTLGILLAPTGSDTINSSAQAYILPPQTVLTLIRDSATNWAPSSTRIPGGLITFPRNSYGYVGTSWGLQWGGGAWSNTGWLTQGLALLGCRLVMQSGAYNAITGSGVGDASYLGRLELVLCSNPGSVILEVGPNDVSNGLSAATIQAAIGAAITMCSTSGRNAIVTTIPPNSGWSTAQRVIQSTVNGWIREQQAQDGVTVIDISAAVTDPLNTTFASWISAYTIDGTHPSPAGSQAMAQVIYNALVNQFSPTNLPSQSDANNAFTITSSTWQNETGGNSGFNEAPANAFGISWYWQTSPTNAPTYTKPARTDGIPGTWQQIVIAAGDGGLLRQSNYTGGIAGTVGQAYVAYLEYQVSGIESSPLANNQALYMTVVGYDAGFSAVMNSGFNYPFAVTTDQIPQTSGVMKTEPFVIPPTCTSLYFALGIQGGATYRFGRVGIIPVI